MGTLKEDWEQQQLTKARGRDILLATLRSEHTQLAELHEAVVKHWSHADPMYRFYHQSFKVYKLQDETEKIVDALTALAPEGRELNNWFLEIVAEGTRVEFDDTHNEDWLPHTRPILEVNFHARFFLEMAVRYGDVDFTEPGFGLPSGWAALLYLYELR
jgi:hypothetical protein